MCSLKGTLKWVCKALLCVDAFCSSTDVMLFNVKLSRIVDQLFILCQNICVAVHSPTIHASNEGGRRLQVTSYVQSITLIGQSNHMCRTTLPCTQFIVGWLIHVPLWVWKCCTSQNTSRCNSQLSSSLPYGFHLVQAWSLSLFVKPHTLSNDIALVCSVLSCYLVHC